MARNPPPARKAECIEAIDKALLELPEGAEVSRHAIYEQFPEIDKNTVWKWCREREAGRPSQLEMSRAARAIQERAEAGILDHLPAVPAPASLARDDGKLRRLDFAVEIPKLYSDAEMLRQFSVKEMEDGEEKIKNPVAFEKSIKARASLIETSLKVLSEVWDMRMMMQFNELIIDEIGQEAPDCKIRILKRLAVLNQRHGVNFNGMRF